ncbi:MAG: hypothetical protein ACR2PH_17615 [Desulfobulbia bacterium]
MALSPKRAIPYFGNPAQETAEGTEYTQRFKVEFENVSTATVDELHIIESLALNAPGVPAYGDTFKGNINAKCERRSTAVISGQETNIPHYVIVTCLFSTIPTSNRGQQKDPLQKQPDIDWGLMFEREVIMNAYERAAFQDGGKPLYRNVDRGGLFNFTVNLFKQGVLNSNNKPFNPQPEMDVPFLTCTITENLETFNPIEALLYTGAINDASITIDGSTFGPGKALCLGRTAKIQYNGDESYRQVVTKLLFKDSHDLIVQDRGFIVFKDPAKKFGGDDDSVETWAKVDGAETSEEVLLDGFGAKLGVGKKPVYLHYKYLKQQNFDKLNLPRKRQ